MADIEGDEDDGLAGQRMIEWLRIRGPDDWHFVASKLNWDHSMDVVQWILDQPSCDKATVAMFFWSGWAHYYLKYPTREAMVAAGDVNLDNFDFYKRLVERWNRGFYTRSSIAFRPEQSDTFARYRQVEAQYAANGLPWKINDDLASERRGTDILSDREYRRRYSDELARLLFALGTDIPHPDRMYGSRGTLIGRLKGFFNLD